ITVVAIKISLTTIMIVSLKAMSALIGSFFILRVTLSPIWVQAGSVRSVTTSNFLITPRRCPRLKHLVMPAWNKIKNIGICK
ncbi:Hypothetical predicted protein, partial [Olea europaea subsp. europaea]